MATKKTYDLAVKTGEYQKDGQTKNRYQNIGSVMEKEDGGKFILLDRTFSPAGVINPDNRDTVIVSLFAVKKDVITAEHKPEESYTDEIGF